MIPTQHGIKNRFHPNSAGQGRLPEGLGIWPEGRVGAEPVGAFQAEFLLEQITIIIMADMY